MSLRTYFMFIWGRCFQNILYMGVAIGAELSSPALDPPLSDDDSFVLHEWRAWPREGTNNTDW